MAFGAERLIIVIQNTRQLRMQKTAISLTRRSAVRSRAVFGPAAGFQDLVEDLDLPAQRVPAQLLDRRLVRVRRAGR